MEKLLSNNINKLNPNTIYDIIIIGGGPAALTSAVFAIRKGFNIALITKDIGGQINKTSQIENYMGYMHIEGLDLISKFEEQVKQFDISFSLSNYVTEIIPNKIKTVILSNQEKYKSHSIIIATGQSEKKLNVNGEEKFLGKGVAYCATCDAPFYKNKNVIIVGGGNSGLEAALDLCKIAKNVSIIHNTSNLSGDSILIEKVKTLNNISIIYNSSIKEIKGDMYVKSIDIINLNTNKTTNILTDGVFIEIGYKPNSKFIKNIINLNSKQEINIDCLCNTNIPGIFAAGDVTSIPYKQVIIAASEGAKATLTATKYLNKL